MSDIFRLAPTPHRNFRQNLIIQPGAASASLSIGVQMAPSPMLFTVICCGASSTAIIRVSIRRPPFCRAIRSVGRHRKILVDRRDSHNLLLLVEWVVHESNLLLNSGVVHKGVELAKGCDCLLNEAIDVVRKGNIRVDP